MTAVAAPAPASTTTATRVSDSFTPIRQYIAATIVFLTLTVAFFNPVFRGFTFSGVGIQQSNVYPWAALPTYPHGVFVQTDQADTYYPWEVFIQRSLRAGSIPLWNPESFAGFPFLANGQSGLFYPPKLLLSFLLSPDWVHDLLIIPAMFLGALAMFALMKEYECGFAGSLLASVAWMFAPYFLLFAQLEIVAPLTLFLPVAVFSVHRAMIRRSWRMTMVAGGALGMIFLGSSVLYVVLACIACMIYALFLALRPAFAALRAGAWRDLFAVGMQLAIIPMVAAGLSAIEIVPSYWNSLQSGRAPLLPSEVQTSPLRTFEWTFAPPPFPMTNTSLWNMTYVGLAVALFAIIGLVQRRPGATFARGLAVGTFLFMSGTPVTWFSYHHIPGMSSFAQLGRAIFLWNLAIAILAGVGLDAVFRWTRNPRVRFLPVVTLRFQRMTRRLTQVAWVIAVLAVLLTAVQLGAYGHNLNPPFQPRQSRYLYPRTPLTDAMDVDAARLPPGERQRYIAVRRYWDTSLPWYTPTFYASQQMIYGWESGNGYESLLPERTVDLWRVVDGEVPNRVLTNPLRTPFTLEFATKETRFDLLSRLGITTVFTPPTVEDDPYWKTARATALVQAPIYAGTDGRLYNIAGAAPRAYVVHSVDVAQSPLDALQRFTDPSFPYRQRVVLEQPPASAPAPASAPVTEEGATITYPDVNGATLDVTTAQAGWVVIADMWGPGWQATVNGVSAPVLRADYALRAIAVPAGASHIVMRYRPVEFFAGAWISAATSLAVVAALLVGAIAAFRKRRREATTRGFSPGILIATTFIIVALPFAIIVAATVGHQSSSTTPTAPLLTQPTALTTPPPTMQIDTLAKMPGTTAYSIDALNDTSFSTAQSAPIPIASNAPITMRGWAVDMPHHSSGGGVILSVDDTMHFQATYGVDRPDVAAALNDPAYTKSGFTISLPAGYLPPGRHTLAIAILTNDRTGYYQPTETVEINVMVPLDTLTRFPESTAFSVDSLNDLSFSQPVTGPIPLPANGAITLRGWAVDLRANRAAGGVIVSIDGNTNLQATYGMERQDVADALGNPADRLSGFDATLPTAALGPGRHTITIRILSNDRSAYYQPAWSVEIEIS